VGVQFVIPHLKLSSLPSDSTIDSFSVVASRSAATERTRQPLQTIRVTTIHLKKNRYRL